MNLYVFSSLSLTNIWAGVGAKKWAISENQANSKGTKTKSQSVKIGSLGLLYCSENQVFTTPFVITSPPDENATIKNIWPEEWRYPFSIQPLGSPQKVLHKDQVKNELPSLASTGKPWNQTLYVQPNFVFQTSPVLESDWEYLYSRLHNG